MWERIGQLKRILWQGIRHLCRQRRVFLTVMKLLQTEQELGRLRTWARKKRLKKPLVAYERKYQKTDRLLARFRKRYGGTVLLCEFLRTAWAQLLPPPRPKRGAAAKYRSRNSRNGYRQNAYAAR